MTLKTTENVTVSTTHEIRVFHPQTAVKNRGKFGKEKRWFILPLFSICFAPEKLPEICCKVRNLG